MPPASPNTTATRRGDATAPDRGRLGPPLPLVAAIAAFLALFVALAVLVSSREPGGEKIPRFMGSLRVSSL